MPAKKRTASRGMPSKKRFANVVWAYLLVGVGIGILIVNPVVNPHPLRWGTVFVLLGFLVYFAPEFEGK